MMHGQEISDTEIYLLIKYIKSVLWRVVKRLSYIEDARCLNVNVICWCQSVKVHFTHSVRLSTAVKLTVI